MAKRLTSDSQKIDYALVVIIALLVLFGMLMIFSTTYYFGYQDEKGPLYYFVRQLAFAGLGIFSLYICSRIEYHWWIKVSLPFFLLTLVVSGGLAFLGEVINGAPRWLVKGSGQPSEVLKLALIIYLAHWLAFRKDFIKTLSLGLIPFGILVGLAAGTVVLQDDLSTSFLIAGTSFIMFLVAGGAMIQLLGIIVAGGSIVAVLIWMKPYRLQRIMAFGKDPFSNPTMDNLQIRRVLEALSTGKLTGVGIGASTHKINSIPAVQTDAVFAIVGEELGFIGAMVLLGLFALLIYRGFKIALNAPDIFGALLATGITVSIALQVLVNTAVITNLIPFTGVPLPFVSSGGSSMVMSLTGIGILLAISRRTMPREETSQPVMDASYETDDFRRRNRGTRVSRARRRANARTEY